MPKTLAELQADAKLATDTLAAAQKVADAEAKAKVTPRSPDLILLDLFTQIVMRLGNRPDLRLLITELTAAIAPKPPPPPRQPPPPPPPTP
jgi:hypothetical protein